MNAWKENGNTDQYAELIKKYKTAKCKWDKKHKENGLFPEMSLYEFCKMPIPPSRVSFNDVGVSLHVYGLYNTYDIEWDDVGSSLKDLLNWVHYHPTRV